MLDLDAPAVSARLRRIIWALDTSPHLLADRTIYVPPACAAVADEFRDSTAGTRAEDMCWFVLAKIRSIDRQLTLIDRWCADRLIDDDQAKIMLRYCGLGEELA